MAVLTNGAPVVTPRGSVLGAFIPKPRPVSVETPAERAPRRTLRQRLAGRGKQIKDGLVATLAFGSMTVAAFEWHPIAGLVAAGVSVLLVDHSIDRGEGGVDERTP